VFEIRMTDHVDAAGVEERRSHVIAYNLAATGYTTGVPLGCLVRDSSGGLIAGLDGFTWGGYAKIEWLWVHDAHRRTGLGTRLVEEAERESARRGCVVVRVDTHTFQAPDFYARLGYSLIGRVRDTPVGHEEVFMQKRLHPEPP
jgi:ribosomal protein S18 acetylase RimI-like enzyme